MIHNVDQRKVDVESDSNASNINEIKVVGQRKVGEVESDSDTSQIDEIKSRESAIDEASDSNEDASINSRYPSPHFTVISHFDNPTSEELLNIILYTPDIVELNGPVKGIRQNFCYAVKNASLDEITADDNGAYLSQRKTTRLFFFGKNEENTSFLRAVHKNEKGKFEYKQRVGSKSYDDVEVSKENVFRVERYY